jgi:hypothetical protein
MSAMETPARHGASVSPEGEERPALVRKLRWALKCITPGSGTSQEDYLDSTLAWVETLSPHSDEESALIEAIRFYIPVAKEYNVLAGRTRPPPASGSWSRFFSFRRT